MKRILFLLTITILSGCGTSKSVKLAGKSFSKIDDDAKVFVLQKTEKLPDGSQFIGNIRVGDTGFTTDCGYDKVISVATTEAKKTGANIIQIVRLKDPSTFGSSCYRLKAKLYRNLDPESVANMIHKREQRNKSRLPVGSDYALIHFYRPSSGMGALLGYKIKNENDSIVGRLRNGEKFIYKTRKFGARSFHATLETKEEITINVKRGKEYFVRCGVNMGIVLGRPDIELIANYIGMTEFEAMEK